MASFLSPLRRANLPAWLLLLGSLLLTLATWQGLRTQSQNSVRQQFELHVRDVVQSIRERLLQHEQILLGGAGLFDASREVSRGAWRDYVKRLNLAEHFPGIQGVGFSQVIPPARLSAHIAAIRAEGFPQYTVRPPGQRDLYTSIIYLEPFTDRNLAAFGFDMYSEATRNKAMRRAAESGGTAISGKVKLVQETHGKTQAGFLMYVPVYRASMPLTTHEERWAALLGFVYSPYRVNDLMRGIMGQRAAKVDFDIFDGDGTNEEARLYTSLDDHPRGTGADTVPPLFGASHVIEAYGQRWTVRLSSRPELEASAQSGLHGLVLLLGCGVSVLLFLMVTFLVSRREQAERIARAMTAEMRHNQERLRINEQRLNEAQRTAQVGSWELDLVNGQLHWTDEIFRLFEIDQARFPATYEGFLNAIHPDDRDAVNQAYTDSLKTRQPYEIKHRLRMADGRIKWVHERCSTDFDADGKPLASRGTVQDITQLTEVERVARDNAQYLQAILDSAVDGIITIDEQGSVLSFNRAAETIFGYRAAEVIGRNVNLLMPEPYHSQHDTYLKNYRETGKARIVGSRREVEGLRRNGDTFPLDLAVSRSEHQGRPMYIGLVRDITERKRIEKIKSEFISTVSHELRTPLTSIRGSLGLITGGALGTLPDQVNAMLKIASNNTERLLLLINDILDIQKIESGQMVFRFKSLEVMPFLRQILQDMATYGDQYDVRFVLTRELPDAHVYADRDRLGQVLANLLSNAAKFSPAGQQVEVAVVRHDKHLRISVADHGAGIPPEFQSRLFERFTQADSSDTRSKGGTGLGLAITKAIVEKHGGQISFDTEVGKGTTFHVDLPQLASSGADLMRVTAAAESSADSSALIVEDDPDVAALVQRMLADVGCHADVAYNAAQARTLLAQHPGKYKFMTLDLVLPGEDGISLLRSLRAEEATRALPVVVVSAKASEVKLEVNGGAVGVVDWLSKPVDQSRLISVVQQVARPGRLARVLHVEDDPDIQRVVQAMLHGHCELVFAATVQAGRELLERESFNLVLLDIGLPDGSGLDLLEVIERRVHPPQVVVFSAQEVPPRLAEKVSAALVKSRTSNEKLLHILLEAVGRG